jgi:hypothetical protein
MARVRNTAVPGTRGTRSCSILAMKVSSGMRISEKWWPVIKEFGIKANPASPPP